MRWEQKKLSCPYLQGAIYFAPDQLQHCCQRFHAGGNMRGEVPIFFVHPGAAIRFADVVDAKRDLIARINRGEPTGCTQCPLLEERDWPEVSEINFLYFAHQTKCNMRCSYCSDTYYGNKRPNYDLLAFLKKIAKSGRVSPNVEVSFAGGEPTLAADFHPLVDFVTMHLRPRRLRFFSNAIIFNEKIAELLKAGRASLTTSIDAGTAETFRKVRGVRQYRRVFANLRRYVEASPGNVIIKYIATDDNITKAELDAFLRNISENKLLNAHFLLSSNNRSERLLIPQAIAMIYLHGRLLKEGAASVVFDEHLRPRLGMVVEAILDGAVEEAAGLDYAFMIEAIRSDPHYNLPEIIVWGAGDLFRRLSAASPILRRAHIKFLVDSNPHKQHTTVNGHMVLPPEEVLKHDTPIMICASFYYREIYQQLRQMGVSERRILPASIL